MAIAKERTPLLVIGGFLGAGKTTVLNHLLSAASGQRFLALINDFGAINIDRTLIASSSADTIELTNGCVCCNIGDDLSQALIQALARRPLPDAIVIEASGVSDPWRIAQIGLSTPDLGLDGILVVVDAGAVLTHAKDPLLADSLIRQLSHADLIVVNKSDQSTDAGLAAVQSWLEAHSPRARRFVTQMGQVPIEFLNGRALLNHPTHSYEPGCCAHTFHSHSDAEDHNHGTLFSTWSYHPEGAYDLDQLRVNLNRISSQVLRIKGFVNTLQRGWVELQFAGNRVDVRVPLKTPQSAVVVAIGLKPDGWMNSLEDCFRLPST